MKALVYLGPNKMEMKEIEEPSPKKDQVKIKVGYCGICGSDLHGYTGESGRKIPPMIMGHEFSGVVVECGSEVTKFSVGDRVCVLPVRYCSECEFCLQGYENICKNRENLGVMDIDGAFTEYICMEEKFVYGLKDSVSDKAGAVIEPLSVSYHAVKNAQPIEGRNVLIAGTGTIGLLVLMIVKANNPNKIVVTDLSDERLRLAKEFGADIIVNPAKQDLGEELEKAGIKDDIELSIECVGATPTCQQTVDFVKIHGRIIWVGNAAKMVTINMQKIVTQELSVQGVYAFTAEDFQNALHMLERKEVPAEKIITRVVSLEETTQAFEELIHNPGNDIKVLVKVND